MRSHCGYDCPTLVTVCMEENIAVTNLYKYTLQIMVTRSNRTVIRSTSTKLHENNRLASLLSQSNITIATQLGGGGI